MIKFEDVTKIYLPSTVGLEKVTLPYRERRVCFLVGPSGSGKSTFIRLLIREIEPDRGRIAVGGRDLDTLRSWKVPTCAGTSGVSSKTSNCSPYKTAFENIMYALVVTGNATNSSRRRPPGSCRWSVSATKQTTIPTSSRAVSNNGCLLPGRS